MGAWRGNAFPGVWAFSHHFTTCPCLPSHTFTHTASLCLSGQTYTACLPVLEGGRRRGTDGSPSLLPFSLYTYHPTLCLYALPAHYHTTPLPHAMPASPISLKPYFCMCHAFSPISPDGDNLMPTIYITGEGGGRAGGRDRDTPATTSHGRRRRRRLPAHAHLSLTWRADNLRIGMPAFTRTGHGGTHTALHAVLHAFILGATFALCWELFGMCVTFLQTSLSQTSIVSLSPSTLYFCPFLGRRQGDSSFLPHSVSQLFHDNV